MPQILLDPYRPNVWRSHTRTQCCREPAGGAVASALPACLSACLSAWLPVVLSLTPDEELLTGTHLALRSPLQKEAENTDSALVGEACRSPGLGEGGGVTGVGLGSGVEGACRTSSALSPFTTRMRESDPVTPRIHISPLLLLLGV